MAILALTHGDRIRHSSFSNDEWLQMDSDGHLTDEQGLILSWLEFWNIRTGGIWEDGWDVIPLWSKKEDECDHKCERVMDGVGGDAETGPITYSHCVDCGKAFVQFGM